MGFFRRFKLTDHSADECRDKMRELVTDIRFGPELSVDKEVEDHTYEQTTKLMEEWGCFRELLARHEKQNQSPLDKP